eukprot:4655026-Lingulodinium_polyedra.AAC.1
MPPLCKKLASNDAPTEKQLFNKVWEKVKEVPAQWEARGSGSKYVRPEIPTELKGMSMTDKLK